MKGVTKLGFVCGLALAGIAGTANAALITLTPVYVGSTDAATVNASTALNLGQLDFTQASSWNSTYKHEFVVKATFTDGAAGEDFRGIVFDVGLNGVTLVGPSQSFPNNKSWFANNPTDPDLTAPIFGTNADGGQVTTDLQAITVLQTNAAAADFWQLAESGAATYTAPFKLGTFFVSTGNTPVAASIQLAETGGGTVPNFSYFSGNVGGAGSAQTVSAGVTAQTYTFPTAIPEPASLGIFAIGALGLLRRRRA